MGPRGMICSVVLPNAVELIGTVGAGILLGSSTEKQLSCRIGVCLTLPPKLRFSKPKIFFLSRLGDVYGLWSISMAPMGWMGCDLSVGYLQSA